MKRLSKKTNIFSFIIAGLILTGCVGNSNTNLTEENIQFLGFSFLQKSDENLKKYAVETDISSPVNQVSPGKEFQMQVSVSNPYEFEILSLTINDDKYQSYEFDSGSDSETLIVTAVAPTEAGRYEYVLYSVKYVEGTEIKYVSLEDADASITVTVA